MKKIMIIGCCGSGKSTLAKAIEAITQLPVIHLDQHYWKPEWKTTDNDEWTAKVKSLAERPAWIMDGNYGGTMDIRLEKADTVIYLDVPTWRCMYRILKRTIQYHGKTRPDMTEGCNERFDLDFLHYVLIFNLKRRKALLKKLLSFAEQTNVVILDSKKSKLNF